MSQMVLFPGGPLGGFSTFSIEAEILPPTAAELESHGQLRLPLDNDGKPERPQSKSPEV